MVAPSHSHQIRYTNSWVMQRHQDSGFVGECGPAFGFGDLNGGGLAFLRVLLLRLRMKLLGISRPPQVGVETIESMNYSTTYHNIIGASTGWLYSCGETCQQDFNNNRVIPPV